MTDADTESLHRRLQDAEARLASLGDALVDGLIGIDESGIIDSVNRAAERQFGWSAAELIGRNVCVLMPNPHRDAHDGYLRKYLRTGQASIIGIGRRVVAQRRDGSQFPVELAVGEVSAPDGRRRFIGLIHDLSRRVRIEQELSRRNDELRLMFRHAPVAILSCDPAGAITDANPAACALLGLAMDALVGRAFTEFVHPQDAALARTLLEPAGEEVRAQEFRVSDAHGRIAVVAAHAGRFSAPEHVEGVVIHLVDRTEQQRAEAEARAHRDRLAHVSRLNTMGEMASGIAHEINQPLTAIATYGRACQRMLAAGRAGAPDFADALEQVALQAERAGDIIRRLRGFVRKHDGRFRPVDVDAEIAAVLKFADLDARARRVSIEHVQGADLPRVFADAIQVQQVLLNLLRNAIEALDGVSADRRTILVACHLREDGMVEVRVVDRGNGLDEAAQGALFQPFQTSKAEGMGLGLSISRSIIESHGGELWYCPGIPMGAEFHFTLRAVQSA
ncbi:MAG: PAS domain S-box protein [Gammaproteobacteria bacterium]